jgi:hypothetical protein
MSHFAKVENGIVKTVIVAEQDFINSGSVGDAFSWVQCSYNNNFRGRFPSEGFTWKDEVFTPPQPYPSWGLNSDNDWEAPVAYPVDDKSYTWNEDTLAWDEVVDPTE